MCHLLVIGFWVILIFLFILFSIIFKNAFLEQRIFVSQLIAFLYLPDVEDKLLPNNNFEL